MRLERIFTYRLLRVLRALIPILVLGLIAVPAWNYLGRRVHRSDENRKPEQLANDLSVRTEGFTFSRTEGGRTLFTIRAKNHLGFKDNRNMGEDVDVTVYGATPEEPSRRIHGRSCSYDEQSGNIRFDGDVQAELDEHTRAHSETLTYNHRDRIVASPEKTTLDRPGSMKGQANSFEYALDGGLLKLTGDVEIQTADQAVLRAGSALFQEKENWATLAEGVFVQSVTGWIRGTSGRADLEPGTYKPKTITIEGNVTGASQAQGGRDAWTMSGGWMEAAMSPTGNPERVKTKGNVRLEQTSGDNRQLLTAGEVNATLNATGKIDLLEAHDNARMTLGSDRTLSSSQIWVKGEDSIETTDESVLQMGENIVEGSQFTIRQGDIIRFSTPRPAKIQWGERRTSADKTDARFDSRTNSLVDLVQSGGFQFRDPQYQGHAENARFEEGGTIVILDGSPVVTSTERRLEAAQIRLNQKDNSFQAAGNVITQMNNAGERVLVKAARAQGGEDSMLYTGNVQMWSGEASIKAERLEAFSEGENNRLHAEGRVQSTLGTIRAVSDKLDYEDNLGLAHYTGSVHAQKQDMILETPDLNVKFRDKNVVEIIAGNGVVVTRGERRGTGETAIYDAPTDSVTLTGNKAQVRDKEHGTVEGSRLLMKTTGETAVVEGGTTGRTVTKHTVKK